MFSLIKVTKIKLHCKQKLASMDKSASIWDYDSMYVAQPRKKRTGSRHLLQTAWLDTEILMQAKWTVSKRIDCHSRIVFPSLFLLFVVLYWPIVLFKKSL